MKKVIKYLRLKLIERKLLWLYIASIIEEKATETMSCSYRRIFRDKAEKICKEWYKVRYDKR